MTRGPGDTVQSRETIIMSMLELNAGDDFIICIDVSASMQSTDTPTGQTRFEYAKEKSKLFCHEAAKYDTDGVSIFRFGERVTKFSDITEDKIDGVFDASPNEMMTNTAEVLRAAYLEHVERKNEQTFVLVITDGTPSSKSEVKTVIADITHRVAHEKEFRITFLQVGNDKGAAEYLKMLDDDLKGAKYDIVDTKRLEEVDFMAAVAGAMND